MELSEDQIAFIRNDLRRRGIVMPSLEDDLLDHLCCMVEAMNDSGDFEHNYLEVLKTFGEQEFIPIQDETRRLILKTKFRTMNTTLRISGITSALFLLAGSFFKFMHWPGANALFVAGIFIMAVVFLPLYFILKNKTGEVSNRNTLLNIIGAVAGISLAAGFACKVQHWPGGNMLYYTGIILLLLGYVPVYLLSVYKQSLNKINAFATVILIISICGVLFIANNTTSSKRVFDAQLSIIDKQNRLVEKELNRMKQRAKLDSATSIQMENLQASINKINAAEQAIISASEGQFTGYAAISHPEKNGIPSQLMNMKSHETPASFENIKSAAGNIPVAKEELDGMPLIIILQRLAELKLEIVQSAE